MHIVEGEWNNKSLNRSHASIRGQTLHIDSHSLQINLKKKLISAEPIHEQQKKTSGGGVKGAAAGAVLGFLVAGPVGTVVGGGLGSKSKTTGVNKLTVLLTFSNGASWVVDLYSTVYSPAAKDLAKLKQLAATPKTIPAPKEKNQSSVKTKKHSIKNNIQVIKKPKHPGYWFADLKKLKKSNSSAALPNYDFLSKWDELDGLDPKALNLFKKRYKQKINEYNKFLNLYFNTCLEIEKEFDQIVNAVIKNLIAQSNRLKEMELNISKFNNDNIKLNEVLSDRKSELTVYKKDLSEKGFFSSKSSLKKKIYENESQIKDITKKITSLKRKITTNSNKIKSTEFKQIANIENNVEVFQLIFKKIYPNSKKLKFNHKTISLLKDQFFLDIYANNFDAIWSEKIKKDKTRVEKEHQLIKEKEKEREKAETKNKTDLDTKERLNKLKNLLEEGFITQSEYNLKRKNVLDDI